jgi:N,N-dimethylformamidase beta subunit-like protein/uncharacterized protein DUF4082/Big-like domain-containing protein
MTHHRRRMGMAALAAFLLIGSLSVAPAAPQAANPPVSPDGLTAISLDGSVTLAWKASPGATSYELYRGTTPGTITDQITPAGYSDATFTDSTAANGTTYYYEVRASDDGGQSVAGQRTTATPQARSCSTGNAVRVENCFPGTAAWKGLSATSWYPQGIEGFASASSVNAGGSVDLRVITGGWDVPYHVEIYRTGFYDGAQGRLVGTIPGLVGEHEYCDQWASTTGLTDCTAFSRTATITTNQDWVSGVYILKLVRDDNGEYSHALLVVRGDGGHSDVLYGVPTNTYQAYNEWGGKSLYSYNSNPPVTDSTANRAVQVSFDRPYQQPGGNANAHDWYTRTDAAWVSWLEANGYDASYVASEDVDANGAQLTNHKVYVSGAHDEYWSQGMFDAVKAARDAGTSVVFTGANTAYWRVRYLASPVSGTPRRVMVGYKSIESGPADPSGFSTSTFRDPAGPNQPENALIGQMYIGDKRADDFPLRVSAQEGKNRVWRYTSVANQAAGATAAIGTALVGWEWDQRFDNDVEPAGVQTLSTSGVAGNVLQDNGHTYATGNTQSNATIYRAASGALVFSTGTNNWWRGLDLNMHGQGEPDVRIKQATANVLDDMGVAPSTLASGLQTDATGAPVLSQRTPAANATGVALDTDVRATFDRELDPSTVDAGDLTLTEPGGATVPATLSLDNPTKSLVLKPTDVLEANAIYAAHLGTGVKSWHGDAPASAATWSFTTGPGAPPVVQTRTPASGATGMFTDAAVTAKFNRRLDPATLTGATFTLHPAAGGANVAATVSYDSATRTAQLQPTARLSQSTAYTATLTTGITASDGIAMAAAASWNFTTGTNVTVSSTFPANGATGLSTQTSVRAVFSRAVDAATVGTDAIKLVTAGGLTITGSVVYDPTTRTATLVPTSALAAGATYTVTGGTGVRGADGAPTEMTTWTFTTAATPPPPPAALSMFPADGATAVSNGAAVKITFDRALDPTTVTAANVTLVPDGGAPVAATVSYDDAAHRITLTPLSALGVGRHYTATVSTLVRSTTGAPPSAAITWAFTAADCPCALMGGQQPAWTGLAVRDGRGGTGPWTYELGTKVTVSQTASLVALRFWKEPGETGTHIGRVWTSSGTLLASATYANETASGWQRQPLATPLTLSPGQTYTISVGMNSVYAKTTAGLAQSISAGPISSVADGANGVFNLTAGSFPSSSWQSSNYFVDGVVKLPAQATHTPGVTTQTPSAGATGVPASSSVTATFSTSLDPSSVTTTTFRLTDPSGSVVPAHVAYDDDTRVATLTPDAALDTGTSYTAHLSTGIRSDDETTLPAAVTWSFATVPPVPPTITATSPVDGATQLGETPTLTAQFSQAMDATTIDASTFTLTGPGGASVPASVDYDAATHTTSLVPTSALASGAAYVAHIGTGVKSARNVALEQPYSWGFTTSSCPCQLFNGAYNPAMTDLSTANGRSGAGWTLEMGVKVHVTQAASLRAIRFYRSPGETGTHVGRVWNAAGQLLASATFASESGSGWQEQALASPMPLTPGQTYVVSVGMNDRFVMTIGTFTNPVTSGPLASVADGANGVFADAAGTLPTQHWGNSDYGIDAVVR